MEIDPPLTYRVEHHDGSEIRHLGVLVGVAPHHTALQPFVTSLALSGAGGHLLLIDDATGEVVARRVLPERNAEASDRSPQLLDT